MLTDRSLTVTFDDNQDIAPSFADDTGDAQSWTAGAAITDIVVPAAAGTAPTYAVVGNLPGGISFNPVTRTISGTPNSVGSGTITISATNLAGFDDWTISYTTAPPPTQEVSISARAGNPTATVNARSVAPPPPQQVALLTRAGNPTANFNLTALPPPPTQQLSMSTLAGNPTATFNLRAVPTSCCWAYSNHHCRRTYRFRNQPRRRLAPAGSGSIQIG